MDPPPDPELDPDVEPDAAPLELDSPLDDPLVLDPENPLEDDADTPLLDVDPEPPLDADPVVEASSEGIPVPGIKGTASSSSAVREPHPTTSEAMTIEQALALFMVGVAARAAPSSTSARAPSYGALDSTIMDQRQATLR
jgi:hypothetical protein